jgi:hypothetical protein
MGLLLIWVLKGYLLTCLRMVLLLRRRFLKECQKKLLPLRWLLLLSWLPKGLLMGLLLI